MFKALIHALLLRPLQRYAGPRHTQPLIVDRIELNHYWWAAGCENHQVILWQWSPEEHRYRAERFFFLDDDASDAPRQLADGTWRFTYRDKVRRTRTLVFETCNFVETVTAHDPWLRGRAA